MNKVEQSHLYYIATSILQKSMTTSWDSMSSSLFDGEDFGVEDLVVGVDKSISIGGVNRFELDLDDIKDMEGINGSLVNPVTDRLPTFGKRSEFTSNQIHQIDVKNEGNVYTFYYVAASNLKKRIDEDKSFLKIENDDRAKKIHGFNGLYVKDYVPKDIIIKTRYVLFGCSPMEMGESSIDDFGIERFTGEVLGNCVVEQRIGKEIRLRIYKYSSQTFPKMKNRYIVHDPNTNKFYHCHEVIKESGLSPEEWLNSTQIEPPILSNDANQINEEVSCCDDDVPELSPLVTQILQRKIKHLTGDVSREQVSKNIRNRLLYSSKKTSSSIRDIDELMASIDLQTFNGELTTTRHGDIKFLILNHIPKETYEWGKAERIFEIEDYRSITTYVGKGDMVIVVTKSPKNIFTDEELTAVGGYIRNVICHSDNITVGNKYVTKNFDLIREGVEYDLIEDNLVRGDYVTGHIQIYRGPDLLLKGLSRFIPFPRPCLYADINLIYDDEEQFVYRGLLKCDRCKLQQFKREICSMNDQNKIKLYKYKGI